MVFLFHWGYSQVPAVNLLGCISILWVQMNPSISPNSWTRGPFLPWVLPQRWRRICRMECNRPQPCCWREVSYQIPRVPRGRLGKRIPCISQYVETVQCHVPLNILLYPILTPRVYFWNPTLQTIHKRFALKKGPYGTSNLYKRNILPNLNKVWMDSLDDAKIFSKMLYLCWFCLFQKTTDLCILNASAFNSRKKTVCWFLIWLAKL